ncbi:MAG TPA: LacI family DNA-binding transcriptional regulator [Actinomycetes bacterium]|jgi:DNA-binding LacI/PurR family transcriptional regulator|nr:LacI family DNA-binding transcriptional regulator [Actinomycetes bacterium]
MASIGEVAREAGVSITTVSHVFSGKRPVAPETRRRVLDVAARLGYRPHRAARGLATGRAMTIGLHFPFGVDSFVLDPYFPELLEGMSAAAVEAGYGFVMIPASPGTRFPLKLALKQRRFDGVIMANPAKDSSLIPMLLRRQIPLVTIGRYLGADQVPWVDNDLRGAMAQLMAHLAEQAYRRPALISLQSTFSCDQDVEESFEKEVRVRGGEVRIVRADDLSEEQGFLLTLRLLSQPVPPDAVVASTDRLAIGVLRAASELSVRIPRDLGVIGMDDSVLARHSHPPLTSVRVGPHSLGQAAIESLLTIVEHSEVPDNRVLPAELVPRASTRRNRRRSTRA